MIRKELKKDMFAEWMNGIFVSLRKRWRAVLRVFLCMLIIAGVLVLVNLRIREKELSAVQLLNKGEVLFRESKFDDAKTIFEEVRRNFPDSKAGGPALIYIGESFCRSGKLNAAEEIFREYLTKYPDGEFSPRAQEGLGYVMEERGKFMEAIDAYRKVYENYPDSYLCPQAVLDIARCYEAMKDWAQAKKTYEEILSLYPWSASAVLARAYLDVVEWEIAHTK